MRLTPSEALVVDALCQGFIAKQIADSLGVSVRTVEKHVWNAKRNNGIKTTIQLCVTWAKNA